MKRFTIAVLLLSCGGGVPGEVRRDPLPASDCPGACDRLRECGRPEGDTPDGGDSCEVVCRNTQEQGFPLIDPACVVRSGCDELESCLGL